MSNKVYLFELLYYTVKLLVLQQSILRYLLKKNGLLFQEQPILLICHVASDFAITRAKSAAPCR